MLAGSWCEVDGCSEMAVRRSRPKRIAALKRPGEQICTTRCKLLCRGTPGCLLGLLTPFLILIPSLKPDYLFYMPWDPFDPALNSFLRDLLPTSLPPGDSFCPVTRRPVFCSQSLHVWPATLDRIEVRAVTRPQQPLDLV